jgi:phage-related protein
MSAFYDRTTGNITGITSPLTGLTFEPVYGSRVSFDSKANIYETQNGYFNIIPMSINSLNAKFELRYDLNESNAQKLVSYVENQEGNKLFAFSDASSFYKTVSGVCDNYAVNHMNKNHYEVAVSFEVNQAPTLLNWSGMTFINSPLQKWSSGQSYKKYDIVYSGISDNKLNNYYYCSGDHTSSNKSLDGPTGSSSKWTQAFFFEPDIALQNDVNIKVDKIEFKNSFIQRMKTRRNLAQTNFSYKFSNVSTREAKAILHFLENKGGFRKFLHIPQSVYNREKVFYAPSWSHTFKYYDSHDIEVSLIEDPLGVIPTGT